MRAEKKPMVRVVGRRGVEALLVLGPDRPGNWMLRSLAGGTLVAAASSAASFCLPLDGTVSGSIMLFVRGCHDKYITSYLIASHGAGGKWWADSVVDAHDAPRLARW
jgi:hypothetical protein